MSISKEKNPRNRFCSPPISHQCLPLWVDQGQGHRGPLLAGSEDRTALPCTV